MINMKTNPNDPINPIIDGLYIARYMDRTIKLKVKDLTQKSILIFDCDSQQMIARMSIEQFNTHYALIEALNTEKP